MSPKPYPISSSPATLVVSGNPGSFRVATGRGLPSHSWVPRVLKVGLGKNLSSDSALGVKDRVSTSAAEGFSRGASERPTGRPRRRTQSGRRLSGVDPDRRLGRRGEGAERSQERKGG